MKIFKLLSALLCYPEPPLLAALNDIEKHCAIETSHAQVLKPLLDYLNSAALIRLQENYVATFDRSTSHSLHLFEHIHGIK